MSVTVSFENPLEVVERTEAGLDDLTNPTRISSVIPIGRTKFSGTTTPAVSRNYAENITLSAGAATIDLEAVNKGDLPDEDWTGLKIEFLKMRAASTNTASVVVDVGAIDGYEIWNGPGRAIELLPGQEILLKYNDAAPTIAAADSQIDLSSAQADAVIDVQLVAG